MGRALQFDAVIGRPVTVGINYPTANTTQPDAAARFLQALRSGSAKDITLYNGGGQFVCDG